MDQRALAKVIFDALEAQGPEAPFVAGEPEHARLDGDFNLIEAAEKLVAWLGKQDYAACPDCDGTGLIVAGITYLPRNCANCTGTGRIPV